MPNKATLTVYNQSGNPHRGAPVEINNDTLHADKSGEVVLSVEKYRTITHLVVNGKNFTRILVNGKEGKLPLTLTIGAKIQAYVSNILHSQETPTAFVSN